LKTEISSNRLSRSFFTGHIVEINVTDNGAGKDFFVHQDLIFDRSQYMKNNFDSTEGSFGSIMLPRISPSTFAIYVNLLYTDRLATKGPGEWGRLCSLYALAQRLQDVETKNLVVDGMFLYLRDSIPTFFTTPVAKDSTTMGATSLKLLYGNTPRNSAARRLVVDFYVRSGHAEWLQAEREEYPAEFVMDVAIRCLQKRSTRLFASGSDCVSSLDYHEPLIAPKKLEEAGEKTGV
jgi:hypothetical protein